MQSHFDKNSQLSTYHNDGADIQLFSTNPPGGKTGAPGEGNCTDCHMGSTQSAAGTVTYAYSDLANEYLPGQSYTIDLSLASGVKNGFELTILDSNGDAAGDFTDGANTSTIVTNSKNYIRHSSSTGITSWSFTWNAPADDLGNLTVYYAVNVSNNAGNSGGDDVYLGQQTINIAADASATAYNQLDQSYNVIVDEQANQLKLIYSTLEYSDVNLNIIDMSGKLIYRESLGAKSPGNQTDLIDLSSFNKTGVYFVSLLIDNYAINRKVILR